MSFFYILFELIIGFVLLLTLTKVLGKTQISQLTPFDFISALILGELVGNAIYDKEVHLGMIIFAIVIWGLLILITEWITQKFRKTRELLEGKPSILIQRGKIDRQALKKNKIDIDQLQGLLRKQNVFSIQEVEYVILETTGEISILKKPKYASPTIEDLSLPEKPIHLTYPLISDGIVDEGNLTEAGFDYNWLMKKLKEKHISNPKEVLYAEWNETLGFFVQKNKV